MSARAQPLGGRIFTPVFNVSLAIFIVGGLLMLWRFAFGLATVTNVSDGFTWGIWKPLNVVTITGIGAGSYGLALLCYVFNRERYHALVRPAILTGALAYTVGGASVLVDLGRWWNILKVPGYFWRWNGNSVLLEVALCVLSYMMVLWIEIIPAILEKVSETRPAAKAWIPRLEKALPFLIALGVLLPSMHQSSLGALFIISPTLHPLWHTGFLGLMFLTTCLMMGYAGIVAQDTITRMAMGWPQDRDLLPGVSKIARWFPIAWFAVRFVDLAVKGRLGLLFADKFSLLFWAEILLAAWGCAVLFTEAGRMNPGKRFGAALLLIASGALYRFDTYVIALRPGNEYWSYFPSVGEIVIALALWAMALCIYLLIAKLYPIVTPPAQAAKVHP